MKFHVNRDVFSEAVSFAVKLLPQRTTQPILAGVLIEATDDGLVARRRSTTRRPLAPTIEADVDEPGTILVSGRLLAEIASRLPNAPVQFVDEDGGIVRQLRLRATSPCCRMPVEEYPTLPEVSGRSGLRARPRTSRPRSPRSRSRHRATMSPR